MEFGKFPWNEIIATVLPTVLAYFTGRYRDTFKKQQQDKKDLM